MDHNSRIISLWKGEKAPIRLKFTGSRASGDIRKQEGFHYKSQVEDQGDESKSFKTRILGDEAVETSGKPPTGTIIDSGEGFTSYADAAAKQGISISDDEIRSASGTSPGGKFSSMGGLTSRPQASFLAAGLTDETGTTITHKQIVYAVQTDNKADAQGILEELGEPQGFSRELVVVGDSVYRVSGTDTLEFENLDNPLDGIIMIKEYVPRIIAENGKIKAIELLRRNSEEMEEDEMTQELSDLTAMFQIEIG